MLIRLVFEEQFHKKVEYPFSLGGLRFIKNATHTSGSFLLDLE